jgi:LPPG:FO 2-phospho-L-lactate transferase
MAIVALAGGVGGAKLADGLARMLPDGDLTVVVNIGDDFEHFGLKICPDLDTVMYTLGGVANPETGWGVKDESWQMLVMLEKYGEAPWFRLGDRDMATHLLRRHLLGAGHSLTDITKRLSRGLGITHTILPASDDRHATMLDTDSGTTLAFQEYFVRYRWQPIVKRVWYASDGNAAPSDAVVVALDEAEAIIICPSNPILSIDPILSLGDLRTRLEKRRVPCIAVSPLIKGQAIKGPANKIMNELGYHPSTSGLLDYYAGLIDALVVDVGDGALDGTVYETRILMNSTQDRERLAREVLGWAEKLAV